MNKQRTLLFINLFLLSSKIFSQSDWTPVGPNDNIINTPICAYPVITNSSYFNNNICIYQGQPTIIFASQNGSSDNLNVYQFDGNITWNAMAVPPVPNYSAGTASLFVDNNQNLWARAVGNTEINYQWYTNANTVMYDGVSSWSSYSAAIITDLTPASLPFVADNVNNLYISDVELRGDPGITGAYVYESVGNRSFSPIMAGSIDRSLAGPSTTSSSVIGEVGLTLDNSQRPYVAYMTVTTSPSVYYSLNAKYYDIGGTSPTNKWEDAGAQPIATGTASYKFTYVSLLTYGNTLYLSYIDMSNQGVYVMKYSNGTWSTIGSNITGGYVSALSMAISPNGVPYIAFGRIQGGGGGKAEVRRYNNVSGLWESVGTDNFSANPVKTTSLAFDPSGKLYISYISVSTAIDPPTGTINYIWVKSISTAPYNCNPPTVLSSSGSMNLCQGQPITLSVSNPSNYQSFSWTPGGQTSASLPVSTPGNYNVLVTDNNGCQSNSTISVTSNSLPTATISSESSSICLGTSTNIMINLTGSGPWNINYSNGTTIQSVTTTSSPYIFSVSPTTTQTYTINSVSDINNCINSNDNSSVTVNVLQNPSITLVNSKTSVLCYGDQTGIISLNVTGGMQPYAFQWTSNVQNWISNTSNPATQSNLGVGIYVVTVTDQKQCTTTQSIPIVGPQSNLTAPIISKLNDLTCFNANDGRIDISVPSTGGSMPISYSIDGNTPTSFIFSNLQPNNYVVTAIDANNCIAVSNSVQVLSPPSPLNVVNSSINFCKSGSASVLASGGWGNYSYTWSNGLTSSSINNLGNGTYTCTVQDSKGCVFVPASTFDIHPGTPHCALAIDQTIGNSTWTVTANTTNGGSNPIYIWGFNGYIFKSTDPTPIEMYIALSPIISVYTNGNQLVFNVNPSDNCDGCSLVNNAVGCEVLNNDCLPPQSSSQVFINLLY